MSANRIFIVMGVSGCGKSTVAKWLAEATGGSFLDADDFHTAEHKAKMAAGHPLTDEDRSPWLDLLNEKLRASVAEPEKPVFLACSALKQGYRDRLTAGLPQARIVYLKGSPELIAERLAKRKNHFMPASLLQSQLAELEQPAVAIVLDPGLVREALVADFKRQC